LIPKGIDYRFFSQNLAAPVAIGKPERQVHKASHCARKQQERPHAAITLQYYCLFVPHICGCCSLPHPVRGESHNQHSANREVATTSPPFYDEPHQSHVLFVKSAPGTTFTSWSQHHFVAIRKPKRQVRKASSKQQ